MTAPARYSRKRLVVSPREALVAGGPAEELERTLHAHLATGQSAILVDLRSVPHVDSAGIRALVRTHTSAERQGGRLTVVNANEQVRSLLRVSHLDKVLHLGDEAGAKVVTPSTWSTIWLIAGGALLVAALLWLGAEYRMLEEAQQAIPELQVGAQPASMAPGTNPLMDLARLLAAGLIGLLVTGVRRKFQQERQHNQSLEHAKVLLCIAGALMMPVLPLSSVSALRSRTRRKSRSCFC
jgi:anti-sigma B factor antagonist